MSAPSMPIALTIDVEPDHPWPGLEQRDPWLGFEAWIEYVPRLRDRLERATGTKVHFTWALRMDNQVADIYGEAAWVAATYGRELDALRAEGDELGVHPHAWRWQRIPGRWLQDHASDEWVQTVIETSFEAYRTAFGTGCRTHRFGSRFITAAIVRQIEVLGARVDMTVEPGARGMIALEKAIDATGWLPDSTRAPRVPYRPAADDPLRPALTPDAAPGGLWMLPTSAIDPGPWLPRWRRVARRVRFVARPRHRPVELWAPVEPRAFWRLVVAAAQALPTPYLSLVVRSDALIRPYLAGSVTAKLDTLADDPAASQLHFATATEALAELTGPR